MKAFLATVLLVSTVSCRPDGVGGHHGHHGAHHGAHHGDHGAGHHAEHGAAHHTDHGVHHAAHSVVPVSTHHATHTVGGVVSVAPVSPVHHAVHAVHSAPVHHSVHTVQPVSGHFTVAADPVATGHHAVHSAPHATGHHAVHTAPVVSHAVHTAPVVSHAVHAAAPHAEAHGHTVAELISTNPKYSTLYTAVQAAGLTDVLTQPGPYTVFAPTNTAFDKVPAEQLNALLDDKEKLKSVLLRHVITGTTMAGKNFPPGTTTIKAANGEDLNITRDKFIQLQSSAGSAYIVLFDQAGSNGVLHAVDTVF